MIVDRVSWLNMENFANHKRNYHHHYPINVSDYSMVLNEYLIRDTDVILHWKDFFLIYFPFVERNKVMFYLSHVQNECSIVLHSFVFD